MRRARRLAALALPAALALGLAAASAPAAPARDVLVIGDSLGVGMEPYLAPALPGYEVRTDAEIGRASAAGLEVLAQNLTPEDDVVVFALGSNDDPARAGSFAANLQAADQLAGGRCLVLATLEVSGYSGVPEEPLNRAIRTFAAGNANVRVVDWHGAVTPELLVDGGHATAEGYALRADLFAAAIESCDRPPEATGAGVRGEGIPNPDRDALADAPASRDRARARSEPEPIRREEAIGMLADAMASQIAIGALGGGSSSERP